MAKHRIVISVYGGVADIEEGDTEVEVIIRDYDNCEHADEDNMPDTASASDTPS